MLVLGIILLILLLLALLRFGLIIEYSDSGFQMWAKAGFLKFSLSGDGKDKRAKKKKRVRAKRSDLKMPGDLGAFLEIFKMAKSFLGRLKRRLLIKELTLHCTFAGDDAAKTALAFGRGHAVFGFILPVLESNFRIKKQDVGVFADFESVKPGVYAKISVSLAVWEVFYILSALSPMLKTGSKGSARQRVI